MKLLETPRPDAIRAMLEIHARHKGAACEPVGLWLVAQAKQTWPRFAGLSWFKRTNIPARFTILSMHHPAQLCWSWSWSVSFNRRDVRWRSIRKWVSPMRYGSAWLVIPWLFEIRYSRQKYDWMLSRSASQRLTKLAYTDEEVADAESLFGDTTPSEPPSSQCSRRHE